jgi:hypothetical protein
MWIFTTGAGFISVVQKEGESGLCLRARVAADLDAFRERYCPSLSPTTAFGGGDYECRAWASHAAVAEALSKGRAATYGRVWSVLLDLERENRAGPAGPATGRRAPAAPRRRRPGGARNAGDGIDGR